MATSHFDVRMYDGKGDFGSWKKKMRVLLSHHKVVIALEADAAKWTAEQKAKESEIKEDFQSHFSSPCRLCHTQGRWYSYCL